MELARTVSFEEVDKGHKLCYQGEIGDAFYIIFSGSVRVIIDGGVVGELLPGNGFGERSLETDEPRSATCIASEKSQCVVIKSHEYKLMMKMHQQKKFKQVMNFLQVECRMVKAWTYPKIFKLSAVLVRRAFNTGDVIVKQGEESNVMYLLMKGVVEVQKEVTYLTENRWPDVNNEYTVVQHERMVALPLKTLGVGDHFGEEMILGYNDRQYSVVARGQCEVFAVNKGDVRNFFRGNQVRTSTHGHTHTGTHTRAHQHGHTHTGTHTRAHPHGHTQTGTPTRAHTHGHTHTGTHTRAHPHGHTHTSPPCSHDLRPLFTHVWALVHSFCCAPLFTPYEAFVHTVFVADRERGQERDEGALRER